VIEYCDVDDLKAEYATEIKQVLLRHRAHLGYSESQAHSLHGHSQHSAGAASGIMRACYWYVLSACCAEPQVACVTHGYLGYAYYLPWTSAVISDRSNCCASWPLSSYRGVEGRATLSVRDRSACYTIFCLASFYTLVPSIRCLSL
jgi:hypothetical protein